MTDEPRIPNPGAQVIFPNATGLEKAAADVDGERLIDMPAELIIDVWDPYRISRKNLPFLAWAYDVDLWEDGWSEATQREWVARQIEFKTIRGTIESIRMALDFAGRDFAKGVTGYNLVQYITPPQQFWLSPEMTPEEYNNWILFDARDSRLSRVGPWDGRRRHFPRW